MKKRIGHEANFRDYGSLTGDLLCKKDNGRGFRTKVTPTGSRAHAEAIGHSLGGGWVHTKIQLVLMLVLWTVYS